MNITAPAGGAPVTTAPVSTAFSTGSAVFVPKRKQAAVAQQAAPESFPTLGEAAATTGKKTTTVAAPAKKKEDEDPCKGKGKEFFIYQYDQLSNACICGYDQLTFISIHYPEHYSSPIDILMWLYDMAVYRDECIAAANVVDPYGAPINRGKTGKKGKANKDEE